MWLFLSEPDSDCTMRCPVLGRCASKVVCSLLCECVFHNQNAGQDQNVK